MWPEMQKGQEWLHAFDGSTSNVIGTTSDTLGEHILDRTNYYQKLLGLFSYSLDEKKELNKTLLQTELEKITKNYDDYIKKEIMTDGSTLGEDKIINIVKKKYFANNINV